MYVWSVYKINGLLNSRKTVGHIHYFSKETALATLGDTGYEIIDCFYTPAFEQWGKGKVTKTKRPSLLHFPRKIGFGINKDLTARILGGYSLMVLAK